MSPSRASPGTNEMAATKAPVEALTKPMAQRVMQGQQQLKAYQDEKLDIYHGQHDAMAFVFEDARSKRSGMQDEYDRRQQLVIDRLADMKAHTNLHTRKHLDGLKDFSRQFEETVAHEKRLWRQNLSTELAEVAKRIKVIEVDASRLDEAIKQEEQDCLSHTAAETGPINSRLAEHDAFLKVQVDERVTQHKAFSSTLEAEFKRLRRRLKNEADGREKQYASSTERLEKEYTIILEEQKKKDVLAVKRLEEIKASIEAEGVDRDDSRAVVIANMEDFMGHVDRNIAEGLGRQKATQTRLLNMKNSIAFD